MNQMSEFPKIVIGISGAWSDHSDIVVAIAKYRGGYVFAEMILMNTDKK